MALPGTRASSLLAALTPETRGWRFYLPIAVNAVALIVFAAAPLAQEYPAAALGIGVFLLVQMLLPACRPVWSAPLCPGNIAQAFFWVQVVLVPLLIGFTGAREGTLPHLPSGEAINTAICLRVLGYLVFCVAYQYGVTTQGRSSLAEGLQEDRSARLPWLVVFFLGVGLLGQGLAYGSPAGFLEFVSSPVENRELQAQPTTLAGAASTFLRPFLGFGLILLWSSWLRCGGRPRRAGTCAAATAVLLVLLLLANFSYNRGSMVAPLVGVVAAYSVHVRRIPLLVLALGAAFVLFAAQAFGWYRSTDLEISELTTADLRQTWSEDQLAEFFQIYASGPQMTAYLIEQRGDQSSLYWGRTLVCSILYPVPVLGKAFREESGVSILNMLIYQDPDNVDQVIAYDAELFINFHVPGVVFGYAALGWLMRFFHVRFLQAPDAVESYSWLMLGLWTVFPGSLPVASQMHVYFFWPVYGYFALNWIDRFCSRAPRRRPVGQGGATGSHLCPAPAG